MVCRKCKKENLVDNVSCCHCGAKLQKTKNIKAFILVLGGILLVALIFATIILLFVNSGKIKVPAKLNEKTVEALSLYEQEALDTFVNELANSYNQRDETATQEINGTIVIPSERYLNRTEEFNDAFSTIKLLAKSNSNLSVASNGGFVIVMSASLGTTDPYKDSSPEEVDNYIKEQINEIIETYYR